MLLIHNYIYNFILFYDLIHRIFYGQDLIHLEFILYTFKIINLFTGTLNQTIVMNYFYKYLFIFVIFINENVKLILYFVNKI